MGIRCREEQQQAHSEGNRRAARVSKEHADTASDRLCAIVDAGGIGPLVHMLGAGTLASKLFTSVAESPHWDRQGLLSVMG